MNVSDRSGRVDPAAGRPATQRRRLWDRPVPVIGDRTSAAQRDEDCAGWAFDAAARSVLADVLAARRDIRRYRPDPVPDELLGDVLAAGHAAPSVGQSQPWRFIVVRERRTRERAALMADRERLRQAALLSPHRAQHLLDLQLEGIREAPLGVVVACDRRTPPQGVLGRNTFHDADLWSCACAIENMWLTARAAGLGMGWVTLMRPSELAALLGLPSRVETLGWLCLGWPDERPPFPGLERRGWSQKLPLDEVVMADRWPQVAPPPPVSGLPGPVEVGGEEGGVGASADEELVAMRSSTARSSTAGTAAGNAALASHDVGQSVPPQTGAGSPLWSDLEAPDQFHVVGARDRADRLLTPPGSLGKLDQALDRLVAVCGEQLRTGTLVLVGADHPVASYGVSAFDPEVTRQVMAACTAGEALGSVTAKSVGLDVVVVDAGVEGGPLDGAQPARPVQARGDLVTGAALTAQDNARLIGLGRELGARLASTGLVCLGEVGVGNTTVASVLACLLTGISPQQAVGLGAGADSAMVERKTQVVARALARVDQDALRQNPALVLAELGGPEFSVLAGVVVGAAQAGAMVVLDGLATSVAALAAVEVNPAIQSHLVAGQLSREDAHQFVLTQLGLEPLIDLRLRAGEGVGACLAAQTLLTGLRIRRMAGRTR